ncbi:MAG: hypothetical protein IRY99_23165, partial [Isosphaeraceae bacterium]|nr:hypothetical protein [Isosphaeraceae bacterium]
LQARLAEAWGLSDTSHPEFPRQVPAAEPTEMAAPPDPIAYDRDQWRRKLKRILDKLPDTEAEWNPMLAEGRALGLDEPWMLRAQIEEFALLVRRVIADREFTPQEHRKLELARQLIGMPEAEAEAMLKSIIAEAEAFFGESVKGA